MFDLAVVVEEVAQVRRHVRLQQSDVVDGRGAEDELLRLRGDGVGGRGDGLECREKVREG